MSRTTYAPIESFTGTGSLAAYNFSFKIEDLSQLLVVEYDDNGLETQRVRGTDAVYLSGVTFDATEGGGTVTLAANLTLDYTLKLVLANDSPTQDYQFRGKFSFSLERIEASLDFVVGAVMRLAYLGRRSVKMSDYTLEAAFDPTLPIEITDTLSQTIVTKADGTGLEIGPDITTVLGAVAAAAAAAVSEANASASETAAGVSETNSAASEAAAAISETNAAASAVTAAAEAAAAAVSASSRWSAWTAGQAVTNGQAATDLTGETVDNVSYSSKIYEYEIIRGTTVVANGRVTLQSVNGTWEVNPGSSQSSVAHGVTFSQVQTTTVSQLKAALDSGAGNGTIKLSSRSIPV